MFLYIILILLSATVSSSAQVSSTIQRDNTILPADHGEGALGSFGFRYLTDQYRGPVARIRRGIDSAELDFIPEHLHGDSLRRWLGQNYFTNSEEFVSAGGVEVINDFGLAPNGTNTADAVVILNTSLTALSKNITHRNWYLGDTFTVSVYVKAIKYTPASTKVEVLGFLNGNFIENVMRVGGTNPPVYQYTPDTIWSRHVSTHVISSDTLDRLYVRLLRNAGSGDATPGDTILVWGAQVEEGAQATSYTKTDTDICCDGFVTKLYNQSDLTLDLAMDTLHRQPKVYENGVRAEVGSALAMKFDGQNDMLILPWLSSPLAEAYWAATHEGRGAEDYSIFVSGGGTAQFKDAAAIYSPVDTAEAFKWSIYPSGWITADTFPLTGRPYVYRIHQTDSDSRMYLNQELVFEHPKGAIPTIIARVGCRFAYPADRFFKGTIGELILYPKVRFDYSPASIQTNIARHFKIE